MADSSQEQDAGYIPEHESACLAAHANLANFLEITQHLRDRTERGDSPESDRASQLHRAALIGVIVFTAVALEGAINFYGKLNGIPYYSDVERSLSALNKWRLFPRLAGKQPIGEHILDRIAVVFALRDRVVHPKPKLMKTDTPFRVFMLGEGAYVINTIDLALSAIALAVPEHSKIFTTELPGEVKPDKDIVLL